MPLAGAPPVNRRVVAKDARERIRLSFLHPLRQALHRVARRIWQAH